MANTVNYNLVTYAKESTSTFGSFIDAVFKDVSTSSMNIIDTELYNNYKNGLHTSAATSYISDVYECNLPILSNYIFIAFVPTENNTGAVSLSDLLVTPTILKTLKKYNDLGALVALTGGELIGGKVHLAYFNLIEDSFILYNFNADLITDGTTNKSYTAVEKTKLAAMSLNATELVLGNFKIKHNTLNDTLDFEYII